MADLNSPLLQENEESKKKISIYSEIKSILLLAMGFFFGRVSWITIKITDTALIGHSGTKYLEAASMGDLYMSCTGSFIYAGILNTLVSQARGAGNLKMGATWLNVSIYCLSFVTAIVMIVWFFTQSFISLMGVETSTAANAGYYARILMICLPARMVMGQIAKFFAGNEKPYPQVVIMSFAAILNLCLGLIFVVGIPFPSLAFGFKACPLVTTITEWTSLCLFIGIYCIGYKMHTQFGWEGFYLKDVTNDRVREFMKLYIPQALSLASDFFRVSVIGVFAGTLSEIDIAVFNTGYRVMWLGLTLIGSIGAAVSVQLGSFLGAADEKGARKLLNLGYGLVLAVEAILIVLVLLFIRELAAVFSNDDEVIERFVAVRVPLSFMLLFMTLSVYLESLVSGTGRTREILVVGLIGSWVCQVPLSFVFIHYIDKSLGALYWGVTLGYVLSCMGLFAILATSSWEKLIAEAQLRSEIKR